ncbi:uncharacterized protein DUF4349 [Tamaricihabitans halophyticus]|uniref:Uncharacterized protein DUF4349 n=1 Tax=Tamaricihabitans halophyticus TaxID=1262583 RepID=A0A4R2QSU6_9PSEU|nr:DUF4349 domain-containing protein [Tamaricihabitans halophyticus]TCP52973.1 uncharacterized protein DUF4349 [Tamaricihabitans halophyticus]
MRVLKLALVTGLLGALVGCSTASDEAATGQQADSGAMEQRGSAPQTGSRAESSAETDRGADGGDREEGGSIAIPQPDRQLVRTANLDLTSSNVGSVVRHAQDITSEADGYVSEESSSRDSARLTLRVPAEELDDVLGQLGRVGKVDSKRVRTEDVTEEVVDLRSRVATQRASVQRVRELLERAESVSEVVSVESELTSREAELESMLSRQQELSGQVSLSTVHLTVRGTDVPADEDDAGFLGGLAGGWRAFTGALGAAATGLGAALPFLLLIGVPAVVAWRVILAPRRRRAGQQAPAEASD